MVKFAHVKRKMLHAPISMDFKHTLRSYMTRECLNLRDCIMINTNKTENGFDLLAAITISGQSRLWKKTLANCNVIESINWHMNKEIAKFTKEIAIPAKATLMQGYNRQTIHCYARNRERFLTHE